MNIFDPDDHSDDNGPNDNDKVAESVKKLSVPANDGRTNIS